MSSALSRISALAAKFYEHQEKKEQYRRLAKVANLADALKMPRDSALELLTEHGFMPKPASYAKEMKEAILAIDAILKRIAPDAAPGKVFRLPLLVVNKALLRRVVASLLNLKLEEVRDDGNGYVTIKIGDVARKPKPADVEKKVARLRELERRAAEKVKAIKRKRAEMENGAAAARDARSDSDSDSDSD